MYAIGCFPVYFALPALLGIIIVAISLQYVKNEDTRKNLRKIGTIIAGVALLVVGLWFLQLFFVSFLAQSE